ncbi:MAG: hypothetical protein ACRYGP_20660 [Janthinobacterium lividum]
MSLSMVGSLGVAEAATAHNSQAGGFGQSKNSGATTVNSRRIKHAAKHTTPAAAPEADRDAGMYVVKPQTPPEYFGHGTGSDGSMPQD